MGRFNLDLTEFKKDSIQLDDDAILMSDGRVSVPAQLVSELNWLRGFRKGVLEGLQFVAEVKGKGD